MADYTPILATPFVHLTSTQLRNMLTGMSEEFLIASLQDGAVEVSDGTFRHAAHPLIEFVVPDKLRDSLFAL